MNKAALYRQHELVRQLAFKYLENCETHISARDTDNPFVMIGYDFGINEGGRQVPVARGC